VDFFRGGSTAAARGGAHSVDLTEGIARIAFGLSVGSVSADTNQKEAISGSFGREAAGARVLLRGRKEGRGDLPLDWASRKKIFNSKKSDATPRETLIFNESHGDNKFGNRGLQSR